MTVACARHLGCGWPRRRTAPLAEQRNAAKPDLISGPKLVPRERSLLLVAQRGTTWRREQVSSFSGGDRCPGLRRGRNASLELFLRSLSGAAPIKPESPGVTAPVCQLERMLPVRPHGDERMWTYDASILLWSPNVAGNSHLRCASERRQIRKISSRPPPSSIDDQRGFGDDSRDAARLGGSCRSPSTPRASFSNCRSNLKGRSGRAERPGDRSFLSDTRRTCKPPAVRNHKDPHRPVGDMEATAACRSLCLQAALLRESFCSA